MRDMPGILSLACAEGTIYRFFSMVVDLTMTAGPVHGADVHASIDTSRWPGSALPGCGPRPRA